MDDDDDDDESHINISHFRVRYVCSPWSDESERGV